MDADIYIHVCNYLGLFLRAVVLSFNFFLSPFLTQMSPAFFSSLSADSLKLHLLNSLVSCLITTQRSEVAVMVKDCIKKVKLIPFICSSVCVTCSNANSVVYCSLLASVSVEC